MKPAVNFYSAYLILLSTLKITHVFAAVNIKHIISIQDGKNLKKMLKTHTNVLIIYAKSDKDARSSLNWVSEVAQEIRGKGTVLYVNCGENKEKKKLCKKYNASPSPVTFKHYKDGSYNKDYDRKHVAKSLKNFMMDPTGDAPWDEDTAAKNVVHLNEDKDLIRLRRKEKGPLLVMFYAPWCGYCKRLKPEYAAAATVLKGKAVLAGMDVDKPLAMNVRYEFNITGFPTLVYFEGGEEKYRYSGKYDKEGIIEWMKNPKPAEEAPKEEEWQDTPSDVVHLTDATFDEALQLHSSMLVMFYAPWCGHCKAMKPEYVAAAKTLKDENVIGTLAAVDCTKEVAVAKRFDITGYPTVKYFSEGEFKFQVNTRKANEIVEFMKDPKEPPPPPPPELPWSQTSGDKILHLKNENFKDTVKKRKHVLVMFYAPWCGHCKKAKPEFEFASETFKDDRKVAFVGVDCTVEQDICQTFGVEGYPTFRYFNYGKNDFKYSGGRKADDFIAFMKDPKEGPPPPPPEKEWKDTPSAVHHLTDSEFDDFVSNHESVLVMFYAPWCGHCKAMKPAFIDAAEELAAKKDSGVLAAVDCTKERGLVEKFSIRGFPTIKYFRNGKVQGEYESGRSKEDLVNFMMNPSATPPPRAKDPDWQDTNKDIAFLTKDTFDSFVEEHKSVLIMFYAPWCGHCKRMKPEYEQAAKMINIENKAPGKLAAVDCTVQTDLAQKFDIRGYPTLKYFKDGKEEYKYKFSRTATSILEFMQSPRAPPPSRPPPKEWSTDPSNVTFLTSETFDEFAKNQSSMLVMFYAPWCGHCASLKPEYYEAANVLKTVEPSAVLAAVDCTKHRDIQQKYKIKGYPTVKYFSDGEEIMDYEEGRTASKIIEFMRKLDKSASRKADVDNAKWSELPSSVIHLGPQDFQEKLGKVKHGLVMYHISWCEHCFEARTNFMRAASRLKTNTIYGFAAVDCGDHGDFCHNQGVGEFPIIKYYENGQFVSDVTGPRNVDRFVSFLRGKANVEKDEL